MTPIIADDDALRRYVPNQIAAVQGERTLYDKLQPWLRSAEVWLSDWFTGPDAYVKMLLHDSELLELARGLVAHQAMAEAIPSLDLVLTLNGYAVVSNANLAPASKERVERLIAAHRTQRDRAVAALVPRLHEIDGWERSAQCDFFSRTLFPFIDDVVPMAKGQTATWERWLALRAAIVNAEARLAHAWFSPELMQALRMDRVTGKLVAGSRRARLSQSLRAVVATEVNGLPVDNRRLDDMVNEVREHPDEFAEWHASATARLFEPMRFENRKSDNGYFF